METETGPGRRGTIALVGAGEFLEPMKPVDQALLAAGGRRVVVLPTASAPDGAGVPERWGAMGVQHFQALGAAAQAVMALDRAACSDPALAERVGAAELVYFSGGKPDYLYRTLEGTPLWMAVLEVLARGGVLAGAMILGAHMPAFPGLPGWKPAFGLIPRAIVIPHFDELPRAILRMALAARPRGTYLIGVDRATALVGWAEQWTVMGEGGVTVRGRGRPTRHAPGEVVRLPPADA